MDKQMKIAIILSAYDKMSTIINSSVAKAQNKLQNLSKSISKYGSYAAIAGGIVTGYLGTTIHAAEESAIAHKKLETVFRNMGQNYSVATQQAEAYAEKLQDQIGIEDEAIMAVQTKLATFSKASNEMARQNGTFNRVVAAAFDLQAVGYGDAMSNVVQLGKAFNDPINMATALKKAGTLTVEELLKVKKLTERQGTAKGQEYLMKAIERQVKGAAAANATATQKIMVQWSKVQEIIGNKLLPTFVKYTDYIANVLVPRVIDFVTKHQDLIKYVAIAGIGLMGLGIAAKTLSPIISLLSFTYGASAKALKFFEITVSTTNKVLMTSGIMLIITAIALGAYLIIKNWDKIKWFFSTLWKSVTAMFSKAWEWVKNMFLNYTPHGLIIKHWDKIKAFFVNLWNYVKNVFMNHVKWVVGLGRRFYDAGKNIIMSIWNGIKSMANKPIELIKNITKKIRDFLPFSPAKEGALRDIHRIKLVETIAASIKVHPVVNAMKQVSSAVFNTVSGRQPALAAAGLNHGGSTFNINITLNGGATKQDAAIISDSIKRTVLQIIKEEEHRKRRLSF